MTKRKSRAKYRPGPVIRCPVAVVALILEGNPMYQGHKVQTTGWMASQQLQMIARSARRGWFRIAIPIEGKENDE